MATTYKILGQNRYSGTSATDYQVVYTVPAATSAIISTVAICNTTPAAYTARLCAVLSGGTAGAANSLLYDVSIAANSTTSLTLGMTLSAGDSIQFASPMSGWVTNHVFGCEIN